MSLNRLQDFESIKEMRLLSADFIGASRVKSAPKAECKTATAPQRHHRKYLSRKSGGVHVRESMIWINQLRLATAKPHIAQTHR
jgi:hypothetical protein